jgi:hypothetical protein
LDFCLLVTQRRHLDDLGLIAVRPAADIWLSIAQAFAGPPGSGRASSGGWRSAGPGSANAGWRAAGWSIGAQNRNRRRVCIEGA